MKINEFIDKPEQEEEKPNLGFNAVEDLHIYMKNDPMFYRKQYYPTIAGMQDKLKSGNPIDTREAMLPMVKQGIKTYCAKYDIPRKPEDLLAPEEIDSLVEKIYGEEMELIRQGDY
jgi:hypothetical protein